jgi:hypothetical protein
VTVRAHVRPRIAPRLLAGEDFLPHERKVSAIVKHPRMNKFRGVCAQTGDERRKEDQFSHGRNTASCSSVAQTDTSTVIAPELKSAGSSCMVFCQ